MPTLTRRENPLVVLHLAHAFMALGVFITLYGLVFHGPYSFIHLEGLALSLYGLAASIVEAGLLRISSQWRSRYINLMDDLAFELHMTLAVVTHAFIFFFFKE